MKTRPLELAFLSADPDLSWLSSRTTEIVALNCFIIYSLVGDLGFANDIIKLN